MAITPDDVHVELRLDAPAGGASSVGRDESGRAVFAEGGLPGELVVVQLHTAKKRFAKGRVVEVVEASPARRSPECATALAGCGGCDLGHAETDLQHDMKRRVVADSLARIARVDPPPLIALRATNSRGYRTTVRLGVVDGRAGFRRRWSHEVVPASVCLVAHPAIEELIAHGRWGKSTEVTIRVSDATGERLAIVDGTLTEVVVPSDVILVHADDKRSRSDAAITEHAAGRDWRISADSFFQAGPAAAAALVDAVADAAGTVAGLTVVDAYCGVGLFAGTVAANATRVVAVERASSSAVDARFNLTAGVGVDRNVVVVESAVEVWTPARADLVIADPARAGLGPAGVDALAATGATRFVLVSCDTGSLGRDVGLLQGCGFDVESVTIVDAFPETSHIETVIGLVR